MLAATAWSASGCERVVVWRPIRPTLRALGGRAPCPATSTGRKIGAVALAGMHAAWVRELGGNQREAHVFTASLAEPRSARRLALARHDADTGSGDHVGHLVGEGTLLVYATWRVCGAELPCPPGVEPDVPYAGRLWRVVAGRRQLLSSAPDAVEPLAVAGGRVLVRRGNGALELRSHAGALLRTFAFGPGAVAQAALGTTQLVVLHAPTGRGGPELQVWDLATGALTRRRALAAAGRARLQDVDDGVLVYVVDATVHLLRLEDGRLRRIVTPGRRPLLAQLEPAGLVYSYRTTGRLRGRVQFVPRMQLGL